ncbi:formate dehydrogenase [Conchiformibius steedae]|uniref:Formate dehydrogenase n=1 Tax=Conchiformibius steedae TaxID=153493 RepID=A0A3P2A9X2_9NEIS|nr:formate dehydrogenase [Conchiformibius steedae]
MMYYAYTAGVGVLSRFYFYKLYLTAQNLLILCGFFLYPKA